MAALLQYNPAQMPEQSDIRLVAKKKPDTNDLLFRAELRTEILALLLLPLTVSVYGTLLLHGWAAMLAAGCGLAFLGMAGRKIREEWIVLHAQEDKGTSLRGQQLVLGKVDALNSRKNGRLGSCNIARYHFLTREGDFRSGMYLSPDKLPEAGEPILIAYDVADPKRIRIIDGFVFYRIPAIG
jgi:hypothetical protein